MKAAVIYENGDPAVLRYEDARDPECHDGWVLRVEIDRSFPLADASRARS